MLQTIEEKIFVVVIEDDVSASTFLELALAKHGYSVQVCETGKDGLEVIEKQNPALVLIDINLPDQTGIEITAKLRTWSRIPIIVLTVEDDEGTKVLALDAGADDYVTKPFQINELLARMRVARRHAEESARGSRSPQCRFGDVEINLARHQVTLKGQEIHLTSTQYGLLAALARHAGQVVTHRQLLREVWGPGYEKETNYLRVYIKQLREKLETDPAAPRYLLNEAGVGYRLQAEL